MRTTDFYSVEQLGPKQSVTPEGFLICHDVPIARTGTLIYGQKEVPVEPGRDGIIRIDRTPEEVFRAETIASFEGKPVTLDHPDDFVTPATWGVLAKGVVQNVRRAGGIEDDLLLADLVITDQQAIDEVRSGLREVSCGYEADYEQVEPGRGLQRNIVGNHVALVERGRCGPRCAIGDKEPVMSKKKSFADRIRAAFMAKDAEAAEEIAKEAESMDEESEEEKAKREAAEKEGKTADAIADLKKTVDTLASVVTKLVKDSEEETEEERKKREAKEAETADDILTAEEAEVLGTEGVTLYTGDSAASIFSRAEILAPGIKLPTMDGLTKAKDKALALCKCQRKALDVAYQTEAGKAAITPFLNGMTADFNKLPAPIVNAAFIGASQVMRVQNNAGGVRSGITTKDFGRATSTADLNARNREFWNNRTSR